MASRITRAHPEDEDGVLGLLQRIGLPLDGLHEHLATTLVARRRGVVVGSAALEVYPDGALLRSVAVAPDLQRQGLGRELTLAAIGMAADARVSRVYLLTTTAVEFFAKLGFESITREDVPKTVLGSIEFVSACPSSATVMRKAL